MSNLVNNDMKITLAKMLDTLQKKVDPSHAALIVIDMQNDFCAKGGIFNKENIDLGMIKSMGPTLLGFIDKAREIGLTVIYIQSIYNMQKNWYLSDVWLEQHKRVSGERYVESPVCERDSWGADFYNGIKPLPGELIINKHRYSAFIDTDLDLVLRSKGIRTLIMSGVTTNCCVESTARDGFMKDYYIVFLRDCTATYSKQIHDNTLGNIARLFGEVVDSNDVIKCWHHRP